VALLSGRSAFGGSPGVAVCREAGSVAALWGNRAAAGGGPGRPPADPRILVTLWLHAKVEGVGSAREVARLCEQHVACQWLCGGVGNHKTLSDFRVGHGALLEGLPVNSLAALLQAGVARLDRVAQDGMRVRASAGAVFFRRHSTLEQCHEQAKRGGVERWRGDLEADPGAASRREAAARKRPAADRERRVREADAHRGAARRAGGAGAPARLKVADGGFRPADNVPFAADTSSGAVAGVTLEDSGPDIGKMAPMSGARSLWPATGPASGRWRLRQARRHRGVGPGRRRDLGAGGRAGTAR
jgi:hypothetical protein